MKYDHLVNDVIEKGRSGGASSGAYMSNGAIAQLWGVVAQDTVAAIETSAEKIISLQTEMKTLTSAIHEAHGLLLRYTRWLVGLTIALVILTIAVVALTLDLIAISKADTNRPVPSQISSDTNLGRAI